jgi:hypothetical protein
MPIIHMGSTFGLTEQTLTLFPSWEFATKFFGDEVDSYLLTFKNRANEHLTGGHVTHYEMEKVQVEDGRWVVRVIQHVK